FFSALDENVADRDGSFQFEDTISSNQIDSGLHVPGEIELAEGKFSAGDGAHTKFDVSFTSFRWCVPADVRTHTEVHIQALCNDGIMSFVQKRELRRGISETCLKHSFERRTLSYSVFAGNTDFSSQTYTDSCFIILC